MDPGQVSRCDGYSHMGAWWQVSASGGLHAELSVQTSLSWWETQARSPWSSPGWGAQGLTHAVRCPGECGISEFTVKSRRAPGRKQWPGWVNRNLAEWSQVSWSKGPQADLPVSF